MTNGLQRKKQPLTVLYTGFVYCNRFFAKTGPQFAWKKACGKLISRAKSSASAMPDPERASEARRLFSDNCGQRYIFVRSLIGILLRSWRGACKLAACLKIV